MNKVRNTMIAGLLMLTVSAMASDGKVISSEERDVTITENNEMVNISILNTENSDYSLYIINPNGEVVFKGKLGNDTSLVKRFDFKGAIKGNYTFKFKTSSGENFVYTLRTGALR